MPLFAAITAGKLTDCGWVSTWAICHLLLSFVILRVPIGLSHTYGGNYFSFTKARLYCAQALWRGHYPVLAGRSRYRGVQNAAAVRRSTGRTLRPRCGSPILPRIALVHATKPGNRV